MTRRKIAFGSLLALLMVGVAAGAWAAGEAYFKRLYGEMDTDQVAATQSKGFFIFCPVLGWRGNPNVSMRHNSGAWVTQNEQGFRDAPWDLDTKKPRVLLLGDSNMWGFGVNDDEYPAFLLNRDHPDIRWFNAGMNGYGTDQQYLVFQEVQPKIRPDLTVLVVCGNDRGENTSRRVRGYNKPFFEWDGHTLALRNSPVPAPAKTDALWVSAPDEIFQKTGSYILYHLAQVAEARKNRAKSQDGGLAKEIAGSSAQDPTEALIHAMYREADGRLLVALISSDPGISALCKKEGIPLLDMGATPVGQPGPYTYPSGRPKYGHWTPDGNRIAANLIAKAALDELSRERVSAEKLRVAAEPHITVFNETGTDLMEIRWIDATGRDWGDQSMVAESLGVGASSAVRMPAGLEAGGVFTLLAVDPDGREMVWPARAVTNGQTVVLQKP